MRLPKPLAALGTCLAALIPLCALADSPAVPDYAKNPPKVESGPPVFAFNGKDLTGFYPYTHKNKFADPDKVFTVVDGQIRISGEDFGGLATGGNFSDYHLVTEWRWGTKTWPPRVKASRDSGILLHCVGADGAVGGHWMESQECQIIEGGVGDFIVVAGKNKPNMTCEARLGPDKQLYFEKGAPPVTRDAGRINWWGRDPAWTDTLGIRGKRDVEKPTGEWNRLEVICDGGNISVILNGLLVNQASKSSHTEGKLQFQSEGAELFFRKIEIRPLIKPTK
ncbi:DUF1080 domain-containing protein [Isosphaeraceae bacterium EP7]